MLWPTAKSDDYRPWSSCPLAIWVCIVAAAAAAAAAFDCLKSDICSSKELFDHPYFILFVFVRMCVYTYYFYYVAKQVFVVFDRYCVGSDLNIGLAIGQSDFGAKQRGWQLEPLLRPLEGISR
jgi:hypothetical protein